MIKAFTNHPAVTTDDETLATIEVVSYDGYCFCKVKRINEDGTEYGNGFIYEIDRFWVYFKLTDKEWPLRFKKEIDHV